MKTLTLAVLLALTGAPALAAEPAATPGAAAQSAAAADAASARAELDALRSQMRDLGKRMAELSLKLGETSPRAYAFRYLGDPDRALLGVVLWPDQRGVKIAGVTPGGPADKAGVKNGDILVAIDGKTLPAGKDPADGAVAAATRALDELKVDQAVKLGLLRDGKPAEVTVKAERREALNWPRAVGADIAAQGDLARRIEAEIAARGDEIAAAREAGEAARREVEAHRGEMARAQREAARAAREAARSLQIRMPWWGLNLASLDKDLAAYFGTERGALVLSARGDAFPGLRGGDVLQAIDGKRVDDPEDAMRQLRDAKPGSTVSLQVLRQNKTVTLSLKAPEFRSLFPLPPEPPEPPAPPAAPTPPIAPATPTPPAPPAPGQARSQLGASPPAPPAAPAPPTPPSPPAPPADDEAD